MTTKVNFPKVRQDYYPLGGGLDLVTPAISINPGKVIDAQNYEPAIGGGYRRIDGYERFDGRASPTAADYWVINATITGTLAVGNTITGATSGATGVVLFIAPTYLVLARVTGTFVAEGITVAAVNVGSTTSAASINGAVLPSDHADYKLLSANDWRTSILVVPGSGPIRGVWVFNDTVYAFRDNAGATAGTMWKSTTAGWVQVTFQTKLPFNAATSQINVGDIVTGGTSGATGTVIGALLMTGTWTTSGVGQLIISGTVGTFLSGEPIKVATVSKATSTAASSAITRLPGGRLEFFNYNFTGSTNSTKMYGVDGVNPAFEFDGTNYFPILTGMASETPSHIIAHKGFLFLSFLGSVQYSALGNPYAWTIVLGAGQIDCSSKVSGFAPQAGTYGAGSSLAIFTADRTFILYGTSNADFRLVSSIFDLGYLPYTLQQVSNDAYGMTSRGIQALVTTLNYGDFDYSSVSHMIQPLITRKRGLECASTTIRTKNQYRVFFTDGTALAVGLTGDKVSGILPLNYARTVRCICSATLTTGAEVCYFGSDDGYVYQDNVGTSQDGAAIESWCRLPFNNDKSPRIRKRFRRAVHEMTAEGYASVNISYDLGYSNPNVQPSAPAADSVLVGSGGYWDAVIFDRFTWDTQYVSNPSTTLEGTETNISMLYYSNRAQDSSHTISGLTLISSPRILSRA
jgi:hypothetical protein